MEKQAQTQLVAVQLGPPPWRTTWQCLLKLKMHMAFDPATLLPGIFPADTLPQVPSDVWTRILVCHVVYNNKSLETARLSLKGGLAK